jgi:hypothetical protein
MTNEQIDPVLVEAFAAVMAEIPRESDEQFQSSLEDMLSVVSIMTDVLNTCIQIRGKKEPFRGSDIKWELELAGRPIMGMRVRNSVRRVCRDVVMKKYGWGDRIPTRIEKKKVEELTDNYYTGIMEAARKASEAKLDDVISKLTDH